MKLFTNGFPKAGNHALVKACELLGATCEVNHSTFAEWRPDGTSHTVMIIRDPRDIVISFLRFNGKQVNPGEFMSAVREFRPDTSLVGELAKFEGWLYSDSLIVRYEALITDDREMRRIAKFLGLDYEEGVWEDLPGRTWTWNEVHSDYRTIWNDAIESEWAAVGGNQLLERWGYEPWKS